VSGSFRVVDSGVRDGRFHIALDQAMIEAHQAGLIPDTVRFIRFPPTALVGRHQQLSAEIDLDYCRAHGIRVGRRITGGGAIYLDGGQLGWALVFHRRTLGAAALGEVARLICEAVAAGLGRFGVDARYRPRNDIEVGGRKISGTGGFYDGDTLIYQGTVLIDLDPAQLLGALRVPRAKLAKRGLDSATQRVVTLRELLGPATPGIAAVQEALLAGLAERLGLAAHYGDLTDTEEMLARRLYAAEIGRDDFVAGIDGLPGGCETLVGTHESAGGTITSYVRLEGAASPRIAQVMITGDFFVAPPRLIFDLEAALRGTELADIGAAVERFFAANLAGALSVTAADFRRSLDAAVTGTAVPAAAH
jgi:lipoate---protein ligase